MLEEVQIISIQRKQFIVIFHSGLNLVGFVDQHALHERVRYEYYLRKLKNESVGEFISKGIEKKNIGRERMVMGEKVVKFQQKMCYASYYYLRNFNGGCEGCFKRG